MDLEQRGRNESSEARTARILRERAKALSRPHSPSRGAAPGGLVVFSVGSTRYGVEVSTVREVLTLPPVVPVPHTPDWVAGVIGYRGRVVAVVDLHPFLGLPGGADETRWQRLLVLEPPGMTFGLLAGALHGVAELEASLLEVPAGPDVEGRPRIVRGLTSDGVAVLDIAGLVLHPRFRVSG